MSKVILECLVYDSEIEADHQFLQDQQSKKGGGGRISFIGKRGPYEIKFDSWLEVNYPEYVRTEISLLSSKEIDSLGKSSNYYRSFS